MKHTDRLYRLIFPIAFALMTLLGACSNIREEIQQENTVDNSKDDDEMLVTVGVRGLPNGASEATENYNAINGLLYWTGDEIKKVENDADATGQYPGNTQSKYGIGFIQLRVSKSKPLAVLANVGELINPYRTGNSMAEWSFNPENVANIDMSDPSTATIEVKPYMMDMVNAFQRPSKSFTPVSGYPQYYSIPGRENEEVPGTNNAQLNVDTYDYTDNSLRDYYYMPMVAYWDRAPFNSENKFQDGSNPEGDIVLKRLFSQVEIIVEMQRYDLRGGSGVNSRNHDNSEQNPNFQTSPEVGEYSQMFHFTNDINKDFLLAWRIRDCKGLLLWDAYIEAIPKNVGLFSSVINDGEGSINFPKQDTWITPTIINDLGNTNNKDQSFFDGLSRTFKKNGDKRLFMASNYRSSKDLNNLQLLMPVNETSSNSYGGPVNRSTRMWKTVLCLPENIPGNTSAQTKLVMWVNYGHSRRDKDNYAWRRKLRKIEIPIGEYNKETGLYEIHRNKKYKLYVLIKGYKNKTVDLKLKYEVKDWSPKLGNISYN